MLFYGVCVCVWWGGGVLQLALVHCALVHMEHISYS